MKSSEQSEESLFLKCLELPPGERKSFLESTCQGDSKLRDNVLGLLRSHESSEEFMNSLPEEDSAAVASRLQRIAPSDESVGDQIGRYHLVEKIGEGAWGAVWKVEQTEDINREVALKILKLGLDTKDFLIRFEAERQMLAMMDHPNIATIYDAGATDFGRPYLVMELVQGKPLIEYADEKQLSIEERVGLFIKVCQALEHAHQKGVIHRDIKPSNILVTLQDAGPVPKVIDFGVAKTNQFRLGDKTLFTSIHTFIGTPLYSSPEQLEFSGQDVDQRSDVYSLGAVLFEFLSGLAPLDHANLSEMGLEALRTIVRETDPPRPSLRFANQSPEEQEKIAEQRNTLPHKLESHLKGDLDWVIMKCLEKDRNRRYESATALSEDLRAFLDFRPVSAAAPSVVYRTRKFIRRNRLNRLAWVVVPTAVLCILALVFFMKGRNSTSMEFTSPLAIALAENNRSIAVLPFENFSADPENDFLADSIHNQLTSGLSRIQDIKTISRNAAIRFRDTTKTSRTIAEELGVITLLTGGVQRMGNSIRVNVQLIDAIDDRNLWGDTYTREFTPNNLYEIQSQICKSIARELNTALTPGENLNIARVPTQSLEALEAYFKGNEILTNGNQVRMPEAVELFERAIELDPAFTLAYVGLAFSYLNYGKPLNERSLPWEDQLKKDEERREKMYAAANRAFALDFDLPEVQILQGEVHYLEKDYDAAEACCKRAIELNPNYANAYYELGNLLYWWPMSYAEIVARYAPEGRNTDLGELQNRYRSETASWLSKAVELEPTNASYRYLLATVLGYLGRLEDEIAQYKMAIDYNPDQASLHKDLGYLLISSVARNDEALVHLRKSLALDPLGRRITEFNANAFENMGDFDEAARWMKRAMVVAPPMARLFEARLLEWRGEDELALKVYREYLAKGGLVAPRARLKVLNDDLRTGHFEEARARYFAAFPELFEPDVSMKTDSWSFTLSILKFGSYAMEIAAILMATGETEQANRLMDETWGYFQFHPLVTVRKFQETLILVLRGDNKRALQVLRDAFNEGLRDKNQFLDARLDPIRNEPEFIAMMAVIDADLANQLANVRRMEANGELAAIPKLPGEK